MTNDYHDRRRGMSDRNVGQGPTEYLPCLAQMLPAL